MNEKNSQPEASQAKEELVELDDVQQLAIPSKVGEKVNVVVGPIVGGSIVLEERGEWERNVDERLEGERIELLYARVVLEMMRNKN